MISTAAAQPLPAASAPQLAASSPVASANAPVQVIAQTIQPQINMPKAPDLAWWEVSGVLPSIAAVVAVLITGISLHINTTRQLRSARRDLEQTLATSNKEASDDRAHTAQESKLDREDTAARAQQDRESRMLVAKHDRLMEARRTIYGEVMADYQKVQALIGGLPSSSLTEPEDTAALSAMSASVNKLWIWGEVGSAWKVRELYSQVNEFFYAALPKARIIKQLKQAVANLSRMMDSCDTEMIRIEREKKELNELPLAERWDESTQQKHAGLDRDYAEQVRVKGSYAIAIHNRELQIAKRSRAYLEFVIERQSQLMNHINSVMASARADVGLDGDTSILEEQSREMSRRVREAIDRMAEEPEGDL
jgi:hypothetical protein